MAAAMGDVRLGHLLAGYSVEVLVIGARVVAD
jgi:hypothetical protein